MKLTKRNFKKIPQLLIFKKITINILILYRVFYYGATSHRNKKNCFTFLLQLIFSKMRKMYFYDIGFSVKFRTKKAFATDNVII